VLLPFRPAKLAFTMSEAGTRKIIHVDMDAFYASVEQRDDPALRGRPVAVGYAAKRGVVAAASYEARTFGVRSAMPSSTALRKCPDLVFVPPRFEIYRAVSQQIRLIFADYTALIEPLSLDEAYLDVTENVRRIPTASATAAEIRAHIFDETGLTASAGISYNKFLAKLASDRRKPNGQFVVTPAMGAAFVEALPVGKFHGVGPVTADRMNRLGTFGATAAQLSSNPWLKTGLGWTPSRASSMKTLFKRSRNSPSSRSVPRSRSCFGDALFARCERRHRTVERRDFEVGAEGATGKTRRHRDFRNRGARAFLWCVQEPTRGAKCGLDRCPPICGP
jgi:hypothetical protein